MPDLDLIQMAALYDTGEILHASLNLREVSAQTTTLGLRVMRAKQCVLFLFDEYDPSLRFHATPELPPEKEAMFAPLRDEVKQNGKIVAINNAYDELRYQPFEAGHILVAPLQVDDKMVGALYVGKAVEGQPFTEGDRNLLEAFAVQVARALSNIRIQRLYPDYLMAMANEMRMPIQLIKGLADLCLKEISGALNDEQKKDVLAIHNKAAKANELLNDMQIVAKIDTAALVNIAVEQLPPFSQMLYTNNIEQ